MKMFFHDINMTNQEYHINVLCLLGINPSSGEGSCSLRKENERGLCRPMSDAYVCVVGDGGSGRVGGCFQAACLYITTSRVVRYHPL